MPALVPRIIRWLWDIWIGDDLRVALRYLRTGEVHSFEALQVLDADGMSLEQSQTGEVITDQDSQQVGCVLSERNGPRVDHEGQRIRPSRDGVRVADDERPTTRTPP